MEGFWRLRAWVNSPFSGVTEAGPEEGRDPPSLPSKAEAEGERIKAQGLLLSPKLGHFNLELK